MTRFVTKRLSAMVVILVILTAVVFLLQQVSGINPVHAYLGPNASQAAVAHETKVLGYDKPIFRQFLTYLGHALRGNLGRSLRTRDPVASDIASYLPATAELALAGLGLALILGAALGLGSVGRWRGAGVLRIVLLSGASVPGFLLALLGILLLNGKLHWLPASGDTGYTNAPTGPTGMMVVDTLLHGNLAMFWDAIVHLILPAICVSLGPAVSIGRVLRTSLEQAMGSDFVRTARAKGLKEKTVLVRHALRNSLSAALSMTGLQVGLMFAGIVVIETIFAWPGIGLYVEQSIPSADFPAIAGVTLVLGVAYVVINAVVDVLQAVVDPRVAIA
jgi:peptide/nickel transport system permease protein